MLQKYIAFTLIYLACMSVYSWSQSPELTLNQCIQAALQNNPNMKISQSNIKIAQKKAKEFNTKLLPSLDFSSSYHHQSDVPEINLTGKVSLPFPITMQPVQIGSYDQYEAKVVISQPLFTGFRLVNGAHAAQAQQEASVSNAAKTELELVYNVTFLYLNLLQAKKVLQIAISGQEQMRAHLHDVENFVEQGLAQNKDLLKARVKTSELDLAVVQAQNAIQLAWVSLQNITGLKFEELPETEEPEIKKQSPPEINESFEQALAQRKELQVLRYNKQAAKYNFRIIKGEKYPALAAFGSYAYGKPGLDIIKNEWMNYWIVGVGLEWKLWHWGETSAKAAQAQLQINQIDDFLQQLHDGIELEVTQACLKVKEANDKISVSQQLLEQAEENYRVTENSYKQGQVNNTEYLDAQMDLTRARMEVAQAEIAYAQAIAFWEKATGKPYPNNSKE